MKFALLSGAYKNAGDFLIVKRCRELLTYVYPGCIITEYERRKLLDGSMEQINAHDYLIIAGGPAYRKKMYPGLMPLTGNLDDIKIPIITMGVGQRCRIGDASTVYRYTFDEGTKMLLNRISDDGVPFSCRDWQSVKMLHNNGYFHTSMTGCPAWYDVPNIDNQICNIHSFKEVNTIYISDPARIENFGQVCRLVDYLRGKKRGLAIGVIFHRGVGADKNTDSRTGRAQQRLRKTLQKKGVECLDISYSAEGFELYGKCDMHIGYRVHAHIYNMSVRKASILIEEDSRGGGANEAMGLRPLKAYRYFEENRYTKTIDKIRIRLGKAENIYLFSELEDYLLQLEEYSYRDLEWAYGRMRETFAYMLRHIQSLDKVCGERVGKEC